MFTTWDCQTGFVDWFVWDNADFVAIFSNTFETA